MIMLTTAVFALFVFAVLGGVLMIVGPYVLAYKLGRWLNGVSAQRDADGRAVPLTRLGRLGAGNLGPANSLAAQADLGPMPQPVAGALTLRPTLGLRVMSVSSAILLLYLLWFRPGELLPNDIRLTLGLTALTVYAVAFTNSAYLRFDRAAPSMGAGPAVVRWTGH